MAAAVGVHEDASSSYTSDAVGHGTYAPGGGLPASPPTTPIGSRGGLVGLGATSANDVRYTGTGEGGSTTSSSTSTDVTGNSANTGSTVANAWDGLSFTQTQLAAYQAAVQSALGLTESSSGATGASILSAIQQNLGDTGLFTSSQIQAITSSISKNNPATIAWNFQTTGNLIPAEMAEWGSFLGDYFNIVPDVDAGAGSGTLQPGTITDPNVAGGTTTGAGTGTTTDPIAALLAALQQNPTATSGDDGGASLVPDTPASTETTQGTSNSGLIVALLLLAAAAGVGYWYWKKHHGTHAGGE